MKDLENNKLFAAVLTGALIAVMCGKAAHMLYRPAEPEKRGYQVEVADAGAAEEEEAVPFPVLLAAAEASDGAKIFKKCVACHTIEQGGPNKIGPNLYGIVGAPKAANADFVYSGAMKNAGGEWDIDALHKFFVKPNDYVPGTKMSFNGFRKEEDIAALIVYLRENGSPEYPLPAAPEAEPAEDAAEEAAAETEETPEKEQEDKPAENASGADAEGNTDDVAEPAAEEGADGQNDDIAETVPAETEEGGGAN